MRLILSLDDTEKIEELATVTGTHTDLLNRLDNILAAMAGDIINENSMISTDLNGKTIIQGNCEN